MILMGILFCLFIVGCFHRSSLIIATKDYVFYNGSITLNDINELIKILNKNNQKHFYINSNGGSSEAGLKMGKYIMENNISVTVVGECHSSCANYIFLPSNNKKATKNAQIGLHGGYQSYYYQRLTLLEKIPAMHQDLYKKTFEDELIKIETEKTLLNNAKINPNIIKMSAEMTYYGDANFNLIIDGEKIEYSTPKIIKSNFELWFPPSDEYMKWGIDIGIIEEPHFIKRFLLKNKSNTTISRVNTLQY